MIPDIEEDLSRAITDQPSALEEPLTLEDILDRLPVVVRETRTLEAA